MTRSDAILDAIEHRHAQALGADVFIGFKSLFRQIAEQQRAWRDGAGGRSLSGDQSGA